ncbi:hypothetical protein LINPERPRIM_LOCUS7185 [Linum perenne]
MSTRLDALPTTLISEGPAAVIWRDEESFSVGSFRRLLTKERFPGNSAFPAKSIWINCVPTKVQFFCWLAWRNRIAIVDNLKRRGLALPNWCVLCKCKEKSINHLFLHYNFTSQVWSKISSTLSIHGLWPLSLTELLLMWKDMNCVPRFKRQERLFCTVFFGMFGSSAIIEFSRTKVNRLDRSL